jgi:hypothetical protein
MNIYLMDLKRLNDDNHDHDYVLYVSEENWYNNLNIHFQFLLNRIDQPMPIDDDGIKYLIVSNLTKNFDNLHELIHFYSLIIEVFVL